METKSTTKVLSLMVRMNLAEHQTILRGAQFHNVGVSTFLRESALKLATPIKNKESAR